jgi:hypothetical protein
MSSVAAARLKLHAQEKQWSTVGGPRYGFTMPTPAIEAIDLVKRFGAANQRPARSLTSSGMLYISWETTAPPWD